MTVCDQPITKVAADEAGAPRNKDFHERASGAPKSRSQAMNCAMMCITA